MTRYVAFIASVVLLAGAALFAVGVGAQQQGEPHGGRGGFPGFPGGPPIDRMAQALGLTDEQKTQIQQIMTAERQVTEPLMKQLGDKHKQIDDATANGQFNEETVRALALQEGQITAELTVEHERAKAKIYNLLTPEQREKAKQMHGPFGGPGRRPGPPPAPPDSNQ
jgi:Spy/CpxP family protein refolding chaperone